MPTGMGIQGVLSFLATKGALRSITWVNLREVSDDFLCFRVCSWVRTHTSHAWDFRIHRLECMLWRCRRVNMCCLPCTYGALVSSSHSKPLYEMCNAYSVVSVSFLSVCVYSYLVHRFTSRSHRLVSCFQEPVLYILGRPYVLRDVDRPYVNLEYTGISVSRVEGMESQLKKDILEEAKRYGDRLLV